MDDTKYLQSSMTVQYTLMTWREFLAEDHRSRTCPGTLASPTGFEVQPPHRR